MVARVSGVTSSRITAAGSTTAAAQSTVADGLNDDVATKKVDPL
jgi:hypothetical protein